MILYYLKSSRLLNKPEVPNRRLSKRNSIPGWHFPVKSCLSIFSFFIFHYFFLYIYFKRHSILGWHFPVKSSWLCPRNAYIDQCDIDIEVGNQNHRFAIFIQSNWRHTFPFFLNKMSDLQSSSNFIEVAPFVECEVSKTKTTRYFLKIKISSNAYLPWDAEVSKTKTKEPNFV